jgi:hypothetical protein
MFLCDNHWSWTSGSSLLETDPWDKISSWRLIPRSSKIPLGKAHECGNIMRKYGKMLRKYED